MRRALIVALAALAGVGCGDRPPERAQTKRPQPEPAPKFAIGKDIPFPSLIAKDGPGPRFFICEVAHRIVEGKLKIPAGYGSPDCTGDQSQVQDLGDGRYAISSGVEIELVWREYTGEAVITAVDGIPRTVRITRLDLAGGAQ